VSDYTCPRCERSGNKGEAGWHFFFGHKQLLIDARLQEPICAWCAGEEIGRDARALAEEHRED